MDQSNDLLKTKTKEDDKKEDEKEDEKEDGKEDEKEDEKEKEIFSKNSIINLARKAGIKAISQQGVDKIKKILNQKIKDTAEKLSIFFMSKNGRTITSKIITQFLESENIYMVD